MKRRCRVFLSSLLHGGAQALLAAAIGLGLGPSLRQPGADPEGVPARIERVRAELCKRSASAAAPAESAPVRRVEVAQWGNWNNWNNWSNWGNWGNWRNR